jgi:hypothetical protein
VLEVEDDDEASYRGFGPKFTAHANRIGMQLGLGPVVPRRRPSDPTAAEARGWPHCVRPARYYGDDVSESALELARGTSFARSPGPEVPTEGVLAVLLHRLDRGEVTEVRAQLRRHLDWVREYRERRWAPRRRAERGQEDVDGSPLGGPSGDPSTSSWPRSARWPSTGPGSTGTSARCRRSPGASRPPGASGTFPSSRTRWRTRAAATAASCGTSGRGWSTADGAGCSR